MTILFLNYMIICINYIKFYAVSYICITLLCISYRFSPSAMPAKSLDTFDECKR